MNRTKQSFFIALLLFCALSGRAAFADAPDRYAPVYPHEPLKAKALRGPVSSLIILPFELIKWPIDKGLVFTDEHKLDKKSLHIYQEMKKYGVTPNFSFVDTG